MPWWYDGQIRWPSRGKKFDGTVKRRIVWFSTDCKPLPECPRLGAGKRLGCRIRTNGLDVSWVDEAGTKCYVGRCWWVCCGRWCSFVPSYRFNDSWQALLSTNPLRRQRGVPLAKTIMDEDIITRNSCRVSFWTFPFACGSVPGFANLHSHMLLKLRMGTLFISVRRRPKLALRSSTRVSHCNV